MPQFTENRWLPCGYLGLVIALGSVFDVHPTAAADQPRIHLNDDSSASLGDLSFPNSGPKHVQRRFLTAVKLLHNFEYDRARGLFRDCQKSDPQFAMAYWGEAMCFNHPIHAEQDLQAGQAVLRRLNAVDLRNTTRRELRFIQSVRILFGKGSKQRRDREYFEALAKASKEFPKDHELACFRALALLGTCAGVRDTRSYIRAAALLEDVYKENPRHPGVLHYLIHCYDDPVHAPLGLRAARTYDSIAENSAHAKHMPSHIYLQLGLWDEMIASNKAAWQAGREQAERLPGEASEYDLHALHALQWLGYGHLQKGNYQRAFELLETMSEIHSTNPTPMSKWYFALMHAAHVVNAPHRQRVSMEIDMKGVELSATASDLFARGLFASGTNTDPMEQAMQGIIALRGEAEKQLQDRSLQHSSYFDGVYPTGVQVARVMELQLEALICLARGEHQSALQRMKDATNAEDLLPVGYAPPLPVKPSHELLAEMLMSLRRPRDAQAHFEKALSRFPRRTLSLIGLAESAKQNGDASATVATNNVLEQVLNNPDQRHKAWKDLPTGPANDE